MKSTRVLGLLGLLSFGTAACGGNPPRPPAAAPMPDLDHVLGGGYVLACWGAQTLTVWRPMRQEAWQFPANAAPLLLSQGAARVPPEGCGAARTTLGALAADVGDGRRISVASGGLRLSQGAADETLWTRPATGPLVDAAWAGDALLLVGPRGLFRWRPGLGEPVAVTLPEALTGRPLVGIFRDGPVFRVRDADGRSWPLVVGTSASSLVAEPQTLIASDSGLRAAIPGGRVEAIRGLDGLRVLDERGLLTHNIETPPVSAFIPLADARLLVAAGDTLLLLRWPPNAPLAGVVEEGRWQLAGETARLFDLGGQAVAVGRYGVVRIPLGQ